MARIVKSIYTGADVTSLGEITPSDTIDGSLAPTITTLTDGATITPNFNDSCNFTVTLGGSRTIANPTNLVPGQSGSIFIVQDATGTRLLGWGTYWKFSGGTAPTLSTTANAVDRLDYIIKSSTEVHSVFTGDYLTGV
jgi:hypothetical protein